MNRNKALKLYEMGMSFGRISKETGLNRATVFRWVKSAGIHEPREINVYSINHEFFDEINSSDKAYWLGFIFADAYIKKRPSGAKVIRFNLSAKDVHQLEKFRVAINYEGPIFSSVKTMKKTGKKHKLVHLSLTNAHMYESLVRHGVLDYKNRGVQTFQFQMELTQHFLRGLFDGDGMVYIHKPSSQIGVGFCDEHKTNVKWFQDQIIHHLGLFEVKINYSKSKKCHRFQYRGNTQVRKIFEWLYRSGPCMERKKSIFSDWFAVN